MAIKRSPKEVEKSAALPAELSELCQKGFTLQALRDRYEAGFKETKKEVAGYLENNSDGFTIEMGKGFRTEQGTVIYQSRDNWAYDKDKIIDLVESGKLSLATVINLAGFNAEKLKTAVGEKVFNDLATNSTTESLTFRANSEFKAQIESEVGDLGGEKKEEEEDEEKPRKKAAPEKKAPEKSEKVKKTLEKIKAMKSKSKKKSADEDLDAILDD